MANIRLGTHMCVWERLGSTHLKAIQHRGMQWVEKRMQGEEK